MTTSATLPHLKRYRATIGELQQLLNVKAGDESQDGSTIFCKDCVRFRAQNRI